MHGDPLRVAHYLRWHLGRLNIDPAQGPDAAKVVEAQRERCKTLVDMAKASVFLYKDFETYDEKAAAKHLTADTLAALRALETQLWALDDWRREAIHQVVVKTAETLGVKMGSVAQPLRVAVSGTTVSPPIDITLELLGKNTSLSRIERAIAFINKKA
jgi:glutamyl-tRNA synthetase